MKNKIVDSHCHLDFNDFDGELDEIVERAKLNAVDYMLSISVDFENFQNIHAISERFDNIWCTTGIHPNNVPREVSDINLKNLEQTLKTNLSKKKSYRFR